MKKIVLLFILIPLFHVAQTKDCIYDLEEKTDSTLIKVLPKKLMYERVFGDSKEFIQFGLMNNNGVPTLIYQLIQKSTDFIPTNCLNKSSRIIIQLDNGKIISLLSINEALCSTLTYDEVDKSNIRILTSYFVFSKTNYDELKKSPISIIRIQYSNGGKDYVIEKEIQSELLKATFRPNQFFIEDLPCIE
ncbi:MULTISPECIES: hypothetical protein [Flavobacterium]|uniref:Uncharacterized protein n=1 Tax=Flavobacterium jumunjinense TaxID=998845 RepID=A0ABV5GRJ4_9FLAO|nr:MULTISPECIES: hypothetical protein [Flavobacterium]